MHVTKIFFSFIATALLLTACVPFHPVPAALPGITSCGNADILMSNLTVKKTTRQYMTKNGRLCLPEVTV